MHARDEKGRTNAKSYNSPYLADQRPYERMKAQETVFGIYRKV